MEPTISRWLDVREAAAYAGVSSDTIYKACAHEELRHTRIGGRRVLKFIPEWLDEWMGAAMVAPRSSRKGDQDGALQTV